MAEQNELQELAAQLKNPAGEKGIEIAHMMNETNKGMTKHALTCLMLSANDNVLELGHGNGGHITDLLGQASDLVYHGLEISELMSQEAASINQQAVAEGKANFFLYDGMHIPFPEKQFDKIFTVNTIYFWTHPEFLLAELYRVLKPKGMLCITYAQADFMKQLPFTQFGFELYNDQKIDRLIEKTPFKKVSTQSQTEKVKSKMGEWADRKFTTVTLQRVS